MRAKQAHHVSTTNVGSQLSAGMSGDGKWLVPGARVENLLPTFGKAGAGRGGGRGKRRSNVAPRYVPASGGEWSNPARRAPQAQIRVADAEFTIPLGMPVAVAAGGNRSSRNTDECIPAFERRGLERRPPRIGSPGKGGKNGGAFSVDESPVFRPDAGVAQTRAAAQSSRIAGGQAGGSGSGSGVARQDTAAAAAAAAASSVVDDDNLAPPVKMHPFFSGIYDPLVDYTLKVEVPARGEFRCVAPDTNFDVFELDRATNTSASRVRDKGRHWRHCVTVCASHLDVFAWCMLAPMFPHIRCTACVCGVNTARAGEWRGGGGGCSLLAECFSPTSSCVLTRLPFALGQAHGTP